MMTDDQMVEATLAEVTALNGELLDLGVETEFAVGDPNEAVIKWHSKAGKVAIHICLLKNEVVIESPAGSSYDMDVAQARENILNSYL